MPAKFNAAKILRKIKPSKVDLARENSLSRNTHLKGDNDIDLFLLFDKKLNRPAFEKEGLRIGKNIFRGHHWEKAYSEHPYIRGTIKGFDVEIVPSYKIQDTSELQSAVDRTPFHTRYLQAHLKERQKDEVRLLKQFLKGIECYGADLRVSSFSGYLVELLVLTYGGFKPVLKAASQWSEGEVIDLEKHYPGPKAAKKNFHKSALMVVDPIDKNRNVAAALSPHQFSRFIAASRAFLKKPSDKFFFGRKVRPWKIARVKKMLQAKELIAVEIGYPQKFIPDIMWGQLKRLGAKLESQLAFNDFRVYRHAAWTDEKKVMVVLIELENLVIQKVHKVKGPGVRLKEHSEKFLKKHARAVAGPRIENGHWVVETKRKYWDARAFLKDYLKKTKREARVGLRTALNKKGLVASEADLIKLYRKNKDFQKFFTEYLEGKETFM
ncbi:MAG: CCA tRNA nucleotidyltransferase [Deltaproteobacteria bacterium]|nr:CCA tRNA nucleotidyltransferase [Deltaproteobacteria bacterium]